jgi:hypothetical protein
VRSLAKPPREAIHSRFPTEGDTSDTWPFRVTPKYACIIKMLSAVSDEFPRTKNKNVLSHLRKDVARSL